MIDYNKVPSPCYVIDEERFRKNLSLIKHVSDESGAEIILAFKGFAMWGVFPVLREYISGAAASSWMKHGYVLKRLVHRRIPIHLFTEKLISTESLSTALILPSIPCTVQ